MRREVRIHSVQQYSKRRRGHPLVCANGVTVKQIGSLNETGYHTPTCNTCGTDMYYHNFVTHKRRTREREKG